ncbi:muconolactone Delta-isomerase family protein [Actinomadura sp. B10D3]|uniref:muconolactone Delta-isomerase n=1 Tax=Actinomadura sp. B10D3 TaxID=3153557 RepID=UPI00325E47B6
MTVPEGGGTETMEFLVEIDIAVPADLPVEERERRYADEAAQGARLAADGVIQRIWRVPGTANNIGVWAASDASELHGHLASLPLFEFMTIRVRPLARHPLEAPDQHERGPARRKEDREHYR